MSIQTFGRVVKPLEIYLTQGDAKQIISCYNDENRH